MRRLLAKLSPAIARPKNSLSSSRQKHRRCDCPDRLRQSLDSLDAHTGNGHGQKTNNATPIPQSRDRCRIPRSTSEGPFARCLGSTGVPCTGLRRLGPLAETTSEGGNMEWEGCHDQWRMGEGGKASLATELMAVQGRTLSRLIRAGRPPPAQARRWAGPLSAVCGNPQG